MEPLPKSWKLGSVSSAVSRTSPIVFRPAASNTFLSREGSRTRAIGVSSGNSGVGPARSFPFRFRPRFHREDACRYS
jgi:hypothetical protein